MQDPHHTDLTRQTHAQEPCQTDPTPGKHDLRRRADHINQGWANLPPNTYQVYNRQGIYLICKMCADVTTNRISWIKTNKNNSPPRCISRVCLLSAVYCLRIVIRIRVDRLAICYFLHQPTLRVLWRVCDQRASDVRALSPLWSSEDIRGLSPGFLGGNGYCG